jgi:hypothetical protein
VPIKIKKYSWKTGQTTELWRGDFENRHPLHPAKQGQALPGLVNFGDFYDERTG